MSQLRWNKHDVFECLLVEPQIEEYEISYTYTITRNGLILSLTVWQYESVVGITLRRDGQEQHILNFALVIRGCVEYKREQGEEYLRICDCRIVEDRFYYAREGKTQSACPERLVDVEIAVDQDIQIRLPRTSS
jgi:hypothetical protein